MTIPAITDFTKITQECIPVDTLEGMRYQITTTVTYAGELPDVFLFVYDIVDALDPKQDAFVRVGSPYDLENIVVGRAATIAAGTVRYRTNAFEVRYTDLELAVQAKQAISQRVDTAVQTWYTYKMEFESAFPLVPTDHPTTDEEYLVTLTGVWQAATAARVAAEAAALAAAEVVKDALAASAAAAALVLVYQTETTFCQTARVTYWLGTPGVKAGVTALAVASNLFFTDTVAEYDAHSGAIFPSATGIDPDWTGIYAALLAMQTALSAWTVSAPSVTLLDTAFSTFCSGASAGYMSAVGDKANKDLAVANAQTAKEQADASVATAQAAEDAALAAIKTACPTFDPFSV